MRITIDTEARVLQLAGSDETREFALFSAEAFQILSRQWIALGWNLGHWSTFSWMGRQLLQLPDDVLRLAELFWQLRPDVIVETIKRSEDGKGLVLRLYEAHGARGSARVQVALPFRSANFCNILEDDLGPAKVSGKVIDITYGPYQIISLKLI